MVPGLAPHLIETFLAGMPGFLFSLRRTDLSLLWISDGAARTTGFDPRDLIARPELFAQRFSRGDRERLSRLCGSAAPGAAVSEDFRFLCADGKGRWHRIALFPSASAFGDPHSVAGMAWSIDDAKTFQKDARLRQAALSAVDAPILLTDLNGKIRLWNAAAERLFGWSAEQMAGNAIHPLFPCPAGVVDGLLRRVREEGVVCREERLARKSGKSVLCRLAISLLRDEDGNPDGTVVAVGDTAEVRGLEHRLQEVFTRLGIIEKVNRIIASEWDIREVQDRIVAELEKLVDFDRTSIALFEGANDVVVVQAYARGRTELGAGVRIPLDRSAPGWVQVRRIARIDDDIETSGEDFAEDGILLREGMRSRLVIPLFAGGQIVGTLNFNNRARAAYSLDTVEGLGSIPDQLALATEKYRTYTLLKESEERYRLLFEQGPPTALAGAEGRFVDVNERLLRLFGYSRKEFLGLTATDRAVDPDMALRAADILAMRTAPMETENLVRRKDGSTFWAHINVFPVSKDLLLAQVTDITERKELEGRYRQAQKMEAVGTLAGGIAHDFNNIIQAIVGYTSLLKSRFEGEEETTAWLEAIERGSVRAGDLTRQLLGFARRGKLEVKPTDLNVAVEKVLSMIRPTFDRSIDIRKDLSGGPASVEGDAAQLEHSLLNLCINARDAMPGGGTLRIETREVTLSGLEAYGSAKAPPGTYISLSVSDTGVGIPPEDLSRIFEPFFTTKEKGKGSGMGLAMVYGIVKNHGGWIDARSAPARGTTFRILLPASRRTPEAPAARVLELPVGGTETILFVDDEAALRSLAEATLGGLGYTVLTARNGVDALARFEEKRGEIALVVLDLVMPEMGGVETFRRIRELDPSARILVSSGYAGDGRLEHLLAEGAAGFLQKPYRVGTLAAAIRQALGGGP